MRSFGGILIEAKWRQRKYNVGFCFGGARAAVIWTAQGDLSKAGEDCPLIREARRFFKQAQGFDMKAASPTCRRLSSLGQTIA